MWPRRWPECQAKHVGENTGNKIYHKYWSAFVGYLYILYVHSWHFLASLILYIVYPQWHITWIQLQLPSHSNLTTWKKNCTELLNVQKSVHRNNILIYIQQDATLHSLFYLDTALHVSGGTSTHHQERKLYLQLLVYVTPLLLSAAKAADSSNGVTNTRCWRYSCLRSWWW